MDTYETKLFDEIYDETYPEILKYVVLNCEKMDDVDDIMQKTYIHVFKAIQKNKPVNKLYVFGIAKHKIKDHYRFHFRKKESALDESIEAVSDEDIEREALIRIQAEEIFSYLREKDILTFRIFFLYFKEDNTINEIAETLNISSSQVKNRLYRTLRELKQKYAKEDIE